MGGDAGEVSSFMPGPEGYCDFDQLSVAGRLQKVTEAVEQRCVFNYFQKHILVQGGPELLCMDCHRLTQELHDARQRWEPVSETHEHLWKMLTPTTFAFHRFDQEREASSAEIESLTQRVCEVERARDEAERLLEDVSRGHGLVLRACLDA
jgi:hypothetical protein